MVGLPISWNQFRLYLTYRAGRTPARERVYERIYLTILRYFRAKVFDLGSVYAFLDLCKAHHNKPATINNYIKFIKHIGRCAHIVWVEDIHYLREQEVSREWLTPDEQKRLITTIPTRQQVRDNIQDRYTIAIITLLATGLRRDELCNLKWSDLHNGTLIIRNTKNSAAKTSPLFPTLEKKILSLNRGQTYIFGSKGEGKMFGHKLNQEIHDRCKIAKIDKDISAHCLRYTAAKEAAKRGSNLAFIQKFLGHKSANTTSKYIQADEEDVRSVAGRLTVNADSHDMQYALERMKSLQSELLLSGFRIEVHSTQSTLSMQVQA